MPSLWTFLMLIFIKIEGSPSRSLPHAKPMPTISWNPNNTNRQKIQRNLDPNPRARGKKQSPLESIKSAHRVKRKSRDKRQQQQSGKIMERHGNPIWARRHDSCLAASGRPRDPKQIEPRWLMDRRAARCEWHHLSFSRPRARASFRPVCCPRARALHVHYIHYSPADAATIQLCIALSLARAERAAGRAAGHPYFACARAGPEAVWIFRICC